MRRLVAAVSVCSLVCCSGCFTAAKRGLAEVKGASSKVFPLQQLSPGTAKAASAHKIATVQADGVGASEIRAALQSAYQKKYAELKEDGKIKPGSGDTLTIRTTVRFYSTKGAGKLIGGMAFVVARIEVANAGGNVVARADALSTTKALRTGTEDLANSMAEEVLEWVSTGKQDDDDDDD